MDRAGASPARTLYELILCCLTVVGYGRGLDRKSTRLNSSHMSISYAVFCLKKKIPQHRGVWGSLQSVPETMGMWIMARPRMGEAREAFWQLRSAGLAITAASDRVGCSFGVAHGWVRECGGIPPRLFFFY